MSRNDIDSLTERLQQLQIEQAMIQREIQDVRQQIREQRTRVRRAIRTDVNGDELRIGDRVRFLTRGRYRSTTGVIIKFGDRFVISLDNEDNKIYREYGNVELIVNEDEQ